MSGHSKWSTIKRAKGAADAKRSAVFSKMAKFITVAAKQGADPSANFTLRMAIDRAKQSNMPKDNIERAIKRGSGEVDGAQIEELVYEGFGPAETQFIVKCLTDNKNRTASQVRHLFTKNGGSFGSVMWNFSQLGIILITSENIKNHDFDELELELIDAGADDIVKDDEGITIYTKMEDLQKVEKFLKEKEITVESAEVGYVAKQKKEVTEADQIKIDKFIDELEDNEDVGDYYSNF